MTEWIEIAPPHSLILVVGSKRVDIPQSFNGALIAATESCVAIGCKAEDEGPSRFALESAALVSPDRIPVFVAQLDTPEGIVALETIFGDRIAQHPAPSPTARVSVWVNDPSEPDEILISIDE